MGLHIYIYKDNLGDCTNNGISSKKIKGLTITNIDAPFETQTISSKNKMLILDRVAKAYSITVYARVHEALEGTTESVD